VDSLARSIADTGLPQPLLVDAARAAIADGDPARARQLAEDLGRSLLVRVVNATGVLLHTNLGRAPLAVHQDAAATNLELDLATGERLLSRFEYRELLENGGCRIVQPDLMHAGGFTECRKIAAMADMHYVPVAPHNPGGPICTAAAMHLAAAIPNFLILEQMEPQRAFRDRASSVPIRFEQGHFLLPEGPGLGIEPNLDALKDMNSRPQPRTERPGSLLIFPKVVLTLAEQ
jgi:hypothetical protein